MTGTMLSPSMSRVHDLNGACVDYTATSPTDVADYSHHVTTKCSHCDYVAHSAQEMTQHRWDVHPLLTRHKQHLMTSPKERRKRPNSESSEEKFPSDGDWIVPRKKLSPAHNHLTSCDRDSPVLDHVRRTRSADEVLKGRSEENLATKCRSLGDLTSSLVTPHSNEIVELLTTKRGNNELKSSHFCHNAPVISQSDGDAVDDLHTLAKAALEAAPMPQNAPRRTVGSNGIGSWAAQLHQSHETLNRWRQPLGPFPNYHLPAETLFYPSNGFLPAASFSSNKCFLNSKGISLPMQAAFAHCQNFPIYFAPTSFPQVVAREQVARQPSKLSTLSDVASRILVDDASVQVPSSVGKAKEKTFAKQQILVKIRKDTTVDGGTPTLHGVNKTNHVTEDPGSRPEGAQVMGDDRVRSLEEALSKIDCCDPHEHSNVLPYKCPDGKWRMVKSRCVGGAWVVHVPGAVQPSVYLPLNRATSNRKESLDNWLKDKLKKTPIKKDFNCKIEQQRHLADIPHFGTVTASRRTMLTIQPDSGSAIKNLLLQRTSAM